MEWRSAATTSNGKAGRSGALRGNAMAKWRIEVMGVAMATLSAALIRKGKAMHGFARCRDGMVLL